MTTRHTITHAEEIYMGDAFKGGYSPDGRRGIQMTHLYHHHFLSTAGVPALGGDADGIFSSFNGTNFYNCGANVLALATGALVSAGSTIINFDVPRNLVFRACNATVVHVKVEGLDQYGDPMAECIIVTGGNNDFISGRKCFKSIRNIYCTAAARFTSLVTMGTGDRLGLPFHLQTADQVVVVTMNGRAFASAAATGVYVIHIGASHATTITTSAKQPDVRGDILFTSGWVPNRAKRLSALLEVDHTTVRKAFGPPQASSAT